MAFVSPSGKFDDDAGLRMAPDEALSVALALLRAALFVDAHVGNGLAPATGARRSHAPRGVRVSRSWWREICAPMDELSAHASNQRPALKNEVYRVAKRGASLGRLRQHAELLHQCRHIPVVGLMCELLR